MIGLRSRDEYMDGKRRRTPALRMARRGALPLWLRSRSRHLLCGSIGAQWLTPRRAEVASRESPSIRGDNRLARISRISNYRDRPPAGWWRSSISKVFASVHLALLSAGRPRSRHDSGGILLSNSRWPHSRTQFDKLPPKEIRARGW